jgi:hypothetical protein
MFKDVMSVRNTRDCLDNVALILTLFCVTQVDAVEILLDATCRHWAAPNDRAC